MTFAKSDLIELTEDYYPGVKGDLAVVNGIVSEPDAMTEAIDCTLISGAKADRKITYMFVFRAKKSVDGFAPGTKVRYESVHGKGIEGYNGMEGVVVEALGGRMLTHGTRIKVTKMPDDLRSGAPFSLGKTTAVTTVCLSQIEDAPSPAAEPVETPEFKVGDRVTVKMLKATPEEYKGAVGTIVKKDAFWKVEVENDHSMLGLLALLTGGEMEHVGDEVRVGDLVQVNNRAATYSWTGTRGIVRKVGGDFKPDRATVEITENAPSEWNPVGSEVYLALEKLDVVRPGKERLDTEAAKKAEAEAEEKALKPAFAVGDRVRVEGWTEPGEMWEGWEGTVRELPTGRHGWYSVEFPEHSTSGGFEEVYLVAVEVREKIEVGDLVRVNSKTFATDLIGVEGTVDFIDETRLRINVTETNGHSEDSFPVGGHLTLTPQKFDLVTKAADLKADPKAAKAERVAAPWADKPIGSVGMQNNGDRVVYKDDEDKWIVSYPGVEGMTIFDDKRAGRVLTFDDFIWSSAGEND